MKIKNIIPLLIGVLLSVNVIAQQDPLFSQYQFNQSFFNPAYTGINDVFNASIIARTQWVGLPGAPKTYTVNASTSLVNNKLGLGVLLTSDNYGINKNNNFQVLYSYKIDLLNGKVFSFGLQSGYERFRYDFDALLLEQADPSLVIQDNNIGKFNVGAGVFFKTKQFYLGVSVPKLINNQYENNGINSILTQRHLYVSAGYVFDPLISIKFKPSFVLKIVEGQSVSLDLNASILLLETLWVGVTLRDFNTAGLNMQFELGDMLRLGYSFEMPFNELSVNNFGTHELMVSIDLELFNNHAAGRRYF